MTSIVFVPGATSDKSVWDKQITALNGYNAIAVDLTDLMTIESMAERVLSVAPEKFILCGTSMGGYVALHAASLAPDRIEKLILCNTNARADTPERKLDRRQQIEAGVENFLQEYEKVDHYRKFLSQKTASPEIISRMKKGCLRVGFDCFARHHTACMNRQNTVPALSQITVQTLIIGGADDVICPTEQQIEMSRLMPHSRLVIFPDCGHLAHWEKEQEFNHLLGAFLAEKTTEVIDA